MKGLREAGSKIAEAAEGIIATTNVEDARRLKRALQHNAPERPNKVTTADGKQGRKQRARRVFKGTGGDERHRQVHGVPQRCARHWPW